MPRVPRGLAPECVLRPVQRVHERELAVTVTIAWQRCLGEAEAIALLATGGYGRGELYPFSDVDLLVLAEPRVQKAREPALARFFALLWDAGLQTSHAVRSVEQCQHAAREDIATLTSLLELRSLGGGEGPREALVKALSPKKLWPPDKYFEAKREEQRARHARYNDTADNLEPNLKEGPGGLRDLHTVTWMGMRLYGVPGLRALVPPVQRRGLVLIDPSYEIKTDYARVAGAIQESLKKFATGRIVMRNQPAAMPARGARGVANASSTTVKTSSMPRSEPSTR